MIDLGTATRFVAAAVGEPGDRTFYFEVDTPTGLWWFVVEKLQVAALAVQVKELLAESGATGTGATIDAGSLSAEPVPAFRVVELRMRHDEETGMYQVELHPGEDVSAEPVAFHVPEAVLDAMCEPALAAVEGGRPRCPRCGLAMDPEGHTCPVHNGDLRHHRP